MMYEQYRVITDQSDLPPHKRERICPNLLETGWRHDVAEGAVAHPLGLEENNYVKIGVGYVMVDMSIQPSTEYTNEIIKSYLRRPEIEWAIDNSFDGLYITKERDEYNYSYKYKLYVYMLDKHATFWTLKFKGS